MARDILSKIEDALEAGTQDPEELVVEVCDTYRDMGDLLAALLSFNGGAGGLDDEAGAFLAKLLERYLMANY